eukprot:862585-Amphidinium_carterae.1
MEACCLPVCTVEDKDRTCKKNCAGGLRSAAVVLNHCCERAQSPSASSCEIEQVPSYLRHLHCDELARAARALAEGAARESLLPLDACGHQSCGSQSDPSPASVPSMQAQEQSASDSYRCAVHVPAFLRLQRDVARTRQRATGRGKREHCIWMWMCLQLTNLAHALLPDLCLGAWIESHLRESTAGHVVSRAEKFVPKVHLVYIRMLC